MPQMPLKQCQTAGCRVLVRGAARCPLHTAQADAVYAERQRQNRARIEDRRSLYRSADWRRLREWWLDSHPVCGVCQRTATDVDHITPHRGDVTLFYSADNLQSLCRSCHANKTCRQDGGFGNRRTT